MARALCSSSTGTGSAAAPITSSSCISRRLSKTKFNPAAHVSNAHPMPEHSLPHPSLEVVGGGLNSFLRALKTLNRPYDPYPVIGWNRHLETIFAAFFRSLPDVRFRRQCLRTKDDGSVALDWVSGDDTQLPPHSPVLILLPGLTGGSGDTYVRHMLLRARSKEWRVLVFNSRGCGDSPVTTSQVYYTRFILQLLFNLFFMRCNFSLKSNN